MPFEFFNKIETALYAERISAYRQDGVDEMTTLARYSLNMALSESLYPALQFAEIALRNAIHNALSEREGTEEWYHSAGFLSQWQRVKVAEAQENLEKSQKEVTPGRVVAELSFGFWTAFFNRAYARKIGHHIAYRAFPYAPRSQRSLQRLASRWTEIRNLRNRVFHHERIIHWRDLSERHEAIIEVIEWIQPELALLTREIDRFGEIYRAGVAPWHQRICAKWE